MAADFNPLREKELWSRRQWLRQAGVGGGLALLVQARPSWAAEEAKLPRATDLIVRTADPLNAEPALDQLAANWLTPAKQLYIRSHGATPEINEAEFKLTISGLVDKPLVLKIKDLTERFTARAMTATLTCAGNRRIEFNAQQPVGGVQWEAGAIGNALWSGVSLAEVLKAVGVQSAAKHVWFEGADRLQQAGHPIQFGGSIPLAKAMTDSDTGPGALLATQMYDQKLSPEHGFPLRAIVPGYIGARSVKWLNRIIVSNQPSPNHYQAGAYKLVTPETESEIETLPPILENVVNGAICTPAAGSKLSVGKVQVTGYALPSGKLDSRVAKVELSTDGGQHWQAAELGKNVQPWCWQLWQASVTVTAETKELIARVTDSSGAVQPEKVAWNSKGYLFNGWYRTPVKVAG